MSRTDVEVSGPSAESTALPTSSRIVDLDKLEDTVLAAVTWVMNWLTERGLLEASDETRDELATTSANDVRNAVEHGGDYLMRTVTERRAALLPVRSHEQEARERRSQLRLVNVKPTDEQDLK